MTVETELGARVVEVSARLPKTFRKVILVRSGPSEQTHSSAVDGARERELPSRARTERSATEKSTIEKGSTGEEPRLPTRNATINEELRSTTEELETSKEELQSVNEELLSVNAELSTKFEEATRVTDDLQNFISSTDIATVFVDNALNVKRYTPRAEVIFNLIPGDIGRCLLDITTPRYPNSRVTRRGRRRCRQGKRGRGVTAMVTHAADVSGG